VWAVPRDTPSSAARPRTVDRGTLKSSVHVEALPNGSPRIVIDAPHAAQVELGSRPHTPPLAPLVEWVRRHRLAFGMKANPRGQEADFVAIARAIQRKIALNGTKPTYFVRNSLPKLVAALVLEFARP
jgi:hypothetical protein